MNVKILLILMLALLMLVSNPVWAQDGDSDCGLLELLIGIPCDVDDEDEEVDAAPSNSAAMGMVSHSEVLSLLPESFFEVVPRSNSTLIRNVHGVIGTLDLAQQLPNQATTMWWVVYNNPQYCASTPCTFDDFANEQVEASFFNVTGRVSDRFGHVSLHGVVTADSGRPGPAAPEGIGPGLLNPMQAEVHLASRTHGRDADTLADLGELETALSTLFGGGCPFDTLDPEAENPYGCTDPTIAFHLP